MNIFWLDKDLKLSAQYHCDKHVVKMITEYVQLLSASSRLLGSDQGYKLSHAHHPCTKWLMKSPENWCQLYELTVYLYEEYHSRYYGRTHQAYETLKELRVPDFSNICTTTWSPPPQCMPEQYKCDDYIRAYRNYYIGDKARFAKWKNGNVPEWFNYNGELI